MEAQVRRAWRVVTLCAVVLAVVHGEEDVDQEGAEKVDQLLRYIWPTPKISIPLSSDHESLETPQFGETLANIVEQKYKHYVDAILPMELKHDPELRRWYDQAESSRVNWCFRRWQRRVFSDAYRVSADELDWLGESTPRMPGIEYRWPEFNKSPELEILKLHAHKIMEVLHQSSKADSDFQRFEDPRILVMGEVYHAGEYLPTTIHTGALMTGKYFARFAKSAEGGGQRLVLEDPRGSTAPFGKEHFHVPKEGEYVGFPAWAPYHMTPAPVNVEGSTVVLTVLLWPKDGVQDLDWEDDPLGVYVYEKVSTITKKPAGAESLPKDRKEL